MSNLEKAKECYKELKSINKHVLGENPTIIEREVAYNAIKKEWSLFCNESVVDEYKVNKGERKLKNMLEKLERILNINPEYYKVYEK